MSRLIDADKLLKIINDLYEWCEDNRKSGLEQAMCIIHEQPTAMEWIPVSERLPDYDEVVLLKIRDGEDYWYDNVVTGKRRKENPFMQRREDYITTGMIVHEPHDVIAWKPITEYKGGDE